MRGRGTHIEQNFPGVRRRSLTTLAGLLKNTSAESVISYISSVKHKKNLKQSQEAITEHFKKISIIISQVDEHFSNRLQNHQDELFSIVKAQIQIMRKSTVDLVERLNMSIAQRNTDDQILRLNNELDYFKAQALSIFNHNKQMKQEVISLKKTIKQMQIQLTNNSQTLQKLNKKLLKEKYRSKKIINFICEQIKSGKAKDITELKINEFVLNNKDFDRFKSDRSSKGNIKVQGISIDVDQSMIKRRYHYNSTINSFQEQKIISKSSPQRLDIFQKSYKCIDKCIQTEDIQIIKQEGEPIYKQLTLRHFSNTSCIDMAAKTNGIFIGRKVKKVDRINLLQTQSKRKEGRGAKCMSFAFNSNKLFTEGYTKDV